MANSPSERWENGRMVERAIETNRWKVDRFGNPIADTAEAETDAEAKMVAGEKSENKAVTHARRTSTK